MSSRLKIYLLSLIFALVWMRAIFGEFTNIDDLVLLKRLQGLKSFDFSQLFWGHRTNSLYYRPLLISTFYVEALLDLINPLAMRLHNVLLHLANTLWLYGIVGKSMSLCRRQAGWWPFGAALLFGLHPLATESVNWVSGRTDLLAGFFVLASTWCILSHREKSSRPVLLLAFVCAFCAMLSKEVAVAFIPGFFLLLWARISEQKCPSVTPLRSSHRLAGMIACFAVGLVAIIWLRSLLISSSMGGIGRTIGIMQRDLVYDGMLFFRLFGFYFKKIVAPWPLNLAIDGVDPLYDLLGFVIVALLVWFFLRNRFAADFFVVAALLLLPAYPISFGQIAWTPYAERYAYVASAFFVCGLFIIIEGALREKAPAWSWGVLLGGLALILGVTTFQRNGLWQSNLTLWADTVRKSPEFISAHTNYAVTLYKHGNYSEAEKEFDLARAGVDYNYSAKNGIIYGLFLEKTGRRDEAVSAYRDVLFKTKGKSSDALLNLLKLCNRSPGMLTTCGGAAVVATEAEQLYMLTSDPQWLVKSADLFAAAGAYPHALELYHQAEGVLASTDRLLPIVLAHRDALSKKLQD